MRIKTQAICGLMVAFIGQTVAQAQTASVDSLALQMANAVPADRFFIRAGVIGVRIKTDSGNTFDVTGPVVTRAEIAALKADAGAAIEASILARDPVGGARQNGSRPGSPTVAKAISTVLAGTGTVNLQVLLDQMDKDGITALGTPDGVKAIAQESVNTAGLSLGYYLTDDYTWMVEAYVLAKPPEAAVYGSGLPTWREKAGTGTVLQPFGLDGQKLLTSKLLPPTVILGRYWGDKNAKFRLYTGAIAMYAIFYDTKATDTLNSFVGGGSPGDTTVSFKNAFGMGPMLGAKVQLGKDWHMSLNVGSVKLKTQGTLITRNTFFTKDTLAIQEFGRPADGSSAGGSVSDVLDTAEKYLDLDATDGSVLETELVRQEIAKLGGATGVTMGAIAYNRGQTNLGSYTRKADSTLKNTLFMFSVGRSF